MRKTNLQDALESLPKLGETDGKEKTRSIEILTINMWAYEVWEAEEEPNGDWMMFGKVHGFETEIGYFSLSQIAPHIMMWQPLSSSEASA